MKSTLRLIIEFEKLYSMCNRLDFICYVLNIQQTGVNLRNANLEGSQMAKVNLRVATLKHGNMKNCDLRGAVLAGADLEVK